ncbi:MAG: hypothetical protein ABR571_00145 [Jatrophihabitans sp.]|uniref:hypothetical protein n=1 Tax=Jatrophihabitans sp. TaxID=1932789 RepID=UPI00390F3D3E
MALYEDVPAGFEGPTPGAGPEDLLDLGPDRRSGLLQQRWADRFGRIPRLTRWAAALTVGSLSAAGYFLLGVGPKPAPGRPDAAPTSSPHFADDQAVDMVAASARDRTPLGDYIRSASAAGSCAVVPVGDMPEQRLEAAVRKALPNYAVRDVGRTLNQFTGMCSLELRASNGSGSTLVATIASPARATKNLFDQTTVASRTDGKVVVSIVSSLTRTGWTITFGAVGPVSDEPSSAVLLELTQDPTLPW